MAKNLLEQRLRIPSHIIALEVKKMLQKFY